MSIETYLAVGGAVITVITSCVVLKSRLEAMDKFEEETERRLKELGRLGSRLTDLEKVVHNHTNYKK